jgi:hypothetical protein
MRRDTPNIAIHERRPARAALDLRAGKNAIEIRECEKIASL